VHRYLNSLWLLAEEHLGRLDFTCCYDADSCITDLGKERASQALKSAKPSSYKSRSFCSLLVIVLISAFAALVCETGVLRCARWQSHPQSMGAK